LVFCGPFFPEAGEAHFARGGRVDGHAFLILQFSDAARREARAQQPVRKMHSTRNPAPLKVLILAVGKSGTTILFQMVKESLQGETVGFFEPLFSEPPDVGALEGKNVVSKVLIQNALGYRHYSPEAFSFFDKRIFIQRDPRDLLVSYFLYMCFHSSITSDFHKFSEFAVALRAKEADPRSLSLLDLLRLQCRLAGSGDAAIWTLDRFLYNLEFTRRVSLLHGETIFRLDYTDIVDGRLDGLERHLGLSLRRANEVQPESPRVARSKTYGDWKNWFLPEDVAFFRPKFAACMKEFAIPDQWDLPRHPRVTPERASGYLIRLADERGHFSALDYSEAVFTAQFRRSAQPSPRCRAYRVPNLRAKQLAVQQSPEARLKNPRVQTLDGEDVNAIVQGQRYVVTCDVEFPASAADVSLWMCIRDRLDDEVFFVTSPAEIFGGEPVGEARAMGLRFEFPCDFPPGTYFVSVGAISSPSANAAAQAAYIVGAVPIVVWR
jgi:hypothetical protein